MSRLHRGRYAPPLVLALGYTLLLLTWAMANPPFAAPDEPDHYLRAVAVAGGAVPGRLSVDVPAQLWTDDSLACNAHKVNTSAACLDRISASDQRREVVSRAGLYPPLFYALPGLAARAASSPGDADRAARLVIVVISAALLLAAILLLWNPVVGLPSLLGIVVAVTPMTLFVGAILNSSALETTAGLAFAAALLRLTRSQSSETWVWLAIAVTGSLLALSRSTGALWLILDLALVTGFVGTREFWKILRARPWISGATAAVLALGIASNRAWEGIYGSEVTQVGPGATPWLSQVRDAFGQLDRLMTEWVGVFGWLDAFMPVWTYLVWLLMGAMLIAVAVVIGSPREKLTLLSALIVSTVVAVVLSATLTSGALGGDVQARHLLPLISIIPLLAGETLVRNFARLRRASVVALAGFVTMAATIQVVAWYANARRHAVGADGPVNFLSHSEWEPPLGWVFWFAVAVLGAALILGCSGAFQPRSESEQ